MTTTAERALLAALEGGCQVPIGAWAHIKNNSLHLKAMVANLDGTKLYQAQTQTETLNTQKAKTIGIELAQKLLNMGADEILRNIKP